MTRTPTVAPPLTKLPQGYFRLEEFDKMIESRGLDVLWTRAVACPCRVPESLNPEPACSMCAGSGWVQVNPTWHESPSTDVTAPRKLRVILSQIGLDVDQTQPSGQWYSSDATITLRGPIRVGFRDRFIALEQEMAWSEVVTRIAGEGAVEVGLQGRPSSEWEQVMRYGPIRVNHVVDRAGVRYREGVDFRLVGGALDGSRFHWLPTKGPAVGVRFGIHYVCRPVWVVDQATFAVQHSRGPTVGKGSVGSQDLPTTFKVRLDYLSQAVGA